MQFIVELLIIMRLSTGELLSGVLIYYLLSCIHKPDLVIVHVSYMIINQIKPPIKTHAIFGPGYVLNTSINTL